MSDKVAPKGPPASPPKKPGQALVRTATMGVDPTSPKQPSLLAKAGVLPKSPADQEMEELAQRAKWFHSLTNEQLHAITDRAYMWLAYRWSLLGGAVGAVMLMIAAIAWAVMGRPAAIVTTVCAVAAALVCCFVVAPRLAETSWKNEKLQAHIYPNAEPYITSFIFGFGFWGNAFGVPAAALLYILLR